MPNKEKYFKQRGLIRLICDIFIDLEFDIFSTKYSCKGTVTTYQKASGSNPSSYYDDLETALRGYPLITCDFKKGEDGQKFDTM